MIEEKLFREDLYYRLAIIKLEIPSLNERRDDILPIARYFVAKIGQGYGKNFRNIAGSRKVIARSSLAGQRA